jgi:hypothetical protein
MEETSEVWGTALLFLYTVCGLHILLSFRDTLRKDFRLRSAGVSFGSSHSLACRIAYLAASATQKFPKFYELVLLSPLCSFQLPIPQLMVMT